MESLTSSPYLGNLKERPNVLFKHLLKVDSKTQHNKSKEVTHQLVKELTRNKNQL